MVIERPRELKCKVICLLFHNSRYYNNVFDQELASLITRPRGPDEIVSEVISLDKDILRDIR